MLKTMDDLERVIDGLLQRLQGESTNAPGTEESLPESKTGKAQPRDHEAVELIRRALERLKSL
jgi:hypothetical protein